jgi:uncharacterized protein (TIGR02996 family)
MSDEDALLAAIIAHPDEDTPRLVYADWLQEHGNPDRAEFIRVQCRLAALVPSHPDWIELTEHLEELCVRLRHRNLGAGLTRAKRFHIGDPDPYGDSYQRGFPYSITYQTYGETLKPKEIAGTIAALTRLVQTTTIRGFHPYQLPLDWLTALLRAPVAAQLTGLECAPMPDGGDPEAQAEIFHRAIATSTALGRLRDLSLSETFGPGSAAALAESTTLSAVRSLTISHFDAPEPTVRKLTGADWFGRLQQFWVGSPEEEATVPLAAGLGALPDLHTLSLGGCAPGAVPVLAAGTFAALGRLYYTGPLDPAAARALSGARFPALTALAGHGSSNAKLDDTGIRALLRAGWFEQLRLLDLSHNALGDKGIRALAAHPVAGSLRSLHLEGNRFGKGGLMALARRGAFPALTTLVLGSCTDTFNRRNNTSADLAAFLSKVQLPNLRRLDLAGWPLGNAGAKALAENPTLAGLTRLDLESCLIGDPGARALFDSPHLQNLVELRVQGNRIGAAAGALADPGVMPRLCSGGLYGNKIPEATLETLERKRPILSLL